MAVAENCGLQSSTHTWASLRFEQRSGVLLPSRRAASTSVPLPHLISNAFSWGQRSCVRVRPSFKVPPHPRIELTFPLAARVMTGGLWVCVCVYCAPPRYWEPFRDCRKETTPLMILPPFAREAAMSGAPLHFSCASIADTLFCSHLCSFSFGGRP